MTGADDAAIWVFTMAEMRTQATSRAPRSRTWWKAKHELVLPVEVLHCAPELIAWGDWGQACVMAFEYRDPRTGEVVTIEQSARPGRGRLDGAAGAG